MIPSDATPPSPADSVRLEFDLLHPPAKVWRALTEPELLREWLLTAFDFRLEPGTAFTFQTMPKAGWDGIVNCRILEIETHKKLSYSWVVGHLETVVTFQLRPTQTGTHLSLLQSGFKPEQKQNFGGARYGWKMMAGKLVDLLARNA